MMCILLAERGYEVTVATSVNDALALAKREKFDLYILDNWFSQGTGVELCEQIRAFDPLTPIMFYSGVAYEAEIKKVMNCGAQAYLVKPDIKGLKETIARLLNEATMRA
jgi:DNA-binding response OmpR family regulator